tara:strand:- start:5182 stop:5760 length:579 start_codon:yes stop_codon:yes gene_type:complete
MIQYNKYVALLVIDFQNDFSDPQGAHYIPGASEIISHINAEINLCHVSGGEVIYTQDWHPPTTKHFASHNGRAGEHCVRNSWGAQIHPDLEISGDVLRKGIDGEDAFSCFSVRDLESGVVKPTLMETLLRDRNIQKIVFVGLSTDFCIRDSAIEALSKGFEVAVVSSCVCSTNRDVQVQILKDLEENGVELA